MTQHAIAIRLADPGDAQAIALMSRDLVETGLPWKYDAARILKAIRDRDTLTPVACDSSASEKRSPGISSKSKIACLTSP